ncbi:MAG: cation transporter [Gammaproteobacteria bacterium]|nr:cation transporter [Gammaproteobacteria bacterium]
MTAPRQFSSTARGSATGPGPDESPTSAADSSGTSFAPPFADSGRSGVDAATLSAEQARYRQIRKVTLVGSVVDLALGVAKIIGGWLWHSEALIADGVHSLSDLVTDIGVILAAKHADSNPDAEHPYGHGRIETVATAGLGLSLILVSAGIGYDAALNLFHPEMLMQPGVAALVIAAISVLSKEAIYHYTMVTARALKSKMLRANAWHSRTDAFSSIIVIIGVSGTMLGLNYLDAIAAIVVAWMVARVGWNLARESMSELIDTGLGKDRVSEIKGQILAVEGVEDLHMLRTRQMAGRALVDVHINLQDPRVSASEAHHVSELVRRQLIRHVDDVDDVTVHADIEDDQRSFKTNRLPPREQVVALLETAWAELPTPRRITLHYIAGSIEAEVELPLEQVDDRAAADTLNERFRAAVATEQTLAPLVSRVRLLFS